MIYLASPFSHESSFIRRKRVEDVCKAAAHLMNRGVMVFSPIAHSAVIAEFGNLPDGWGFWEKFDTEMLTVCSRVTVLTLDGWRESVGVTAEIALAKGLGKPVDYMGWVNGRPV